MVYSNRNSLTSIRLALPLVACLATDVRPPTVYNDANLTTFDHSVLNFRVTINIPEGVECYGLVSEAQINVKQEVKDQFRRPKTALAYRRKTVIYFLVVSKFAYSENMTSLAEICDKLKSEGWRISEQSIKRGLQTEEDVPQPSLSSYKSVKEILLNTDLKDVVDKKIPDDVPNLAKKSSSVTGPRVLQVFSVRNICVPKTAEGGDVESGRLLRLTLTDGLSTFHALEFNPCPVLRSDTAPGTKLLLQGKVPAASGFILLAPKHISVMGGRVDALYDRWRLTESVYSSTRPATTSADGAGRPPWIPFGKGGKGAVINGSLRGFKALKNVAKETEQDDDNDTFSVQRKHAVQEIVKGSTGGKVFGGGRKMVDSAVARVVAAGFPADVAKWALDNNKQDVGAAIRELRAAATGQPVPTPTPRESSYSGGGRSAPVAPRGRGGGRGGPGGRSRRGRGGRGEFDDDDHADYEAMRDAPRPSGPASLFDFFDAKLAERKETVQFVEPISDVRGCLYEGRTGTNDRARRGRGRSFSASHNTRSSRRESPPPPDLSNTTAWPAPGEEPPSKPKLDTSTTFLQSKAKLEEQEEQERELERMNREEQMRLTRERAGTVPLANRSGTKTSGLRSDGDRGGRSDRGRGGRSDGGRGERRESSRGGRNDIGRGRNGNGYGGRKESSYGGRSEDSYGEKNNNIYRGASSNSSDKQSGNLYDGRNENNHEGRNKGSRSGRDSNVLQGLSDSETTRVGRTASSDGVRNETLQNDKNAGVHRGMHSRCIDGKEESSSGESERPGNGGNRGTSDTGRTNSGHVGKTASENMDQHDIKNPNAQYQREQRNQISPSYTRSSEHQPDLYGTNRSHPYYDQTGNSNAYGGYSQYGVYNEYSDGCSTYGNMRGSYRGSRAAYGATQGGTFGRGSWDYNSYGGHRGSYRGGQASYRGSHDSYDSRDYYSGSHNHYGSRGGYGGYREPYGDSRSYRGSYGKSHAGASESEQFGGQRSGMRGGEGASGGGKQQSRGFGGFYQGVGHQAAAATSGGDGGARYTRDQEQLIEQFKQSVQLQGYTGYDEVQELRLPNSRGSKGALEFRRGGF
ncbi:RecQ mediated genome instability protein N-terminal [Trinorchestia longiramus]|nr:RecQ mediated genome instability protein N-terminal [Trinorchestia longiramus]